MLESLTKSLELLLVLLLQCGASDVSVNVSTSEDRIFVTLVSESLMFDLSKQCDIRKLAEIGRPLLDGGSTIYFDSPTSRLVFSSLNSDSFFVVDKPVSAEVFCVGFILVAGSMHSTSETVAIFQERLRSINVHVVHDD